MRTTEDTRQGPAAGPKAPPAPRRADRRGRNGSAQSGRPLRLLTFNYEYPPIGGGGGVFHELIAEELAKRHEVVVITSAFGDLPAHEVRRGVEIHRVPILARKDPSAASLLSMLVFPPAAWWRAMRLLRRRSFDLVHSHFAVPTGPASLPPAMLARLPHVMTIQGGDIYDPSKRLSPHRNALLRAAVTGILRRSCSVVAASRNIVENTYRYYSYRGEIDLIPLGIRRPPRVEPISRAALGLPEGVFLAATVGRLVKRKGLDRLLEALARPECSEVHVVIIGSGPEREPLEAQARAGSLADRVHFAGRVDEERKWQILKSADAYVSATMHEGFGLVYLEAMASGLPVITPGHGGQADFLENGVTGFLVPEGRADALAAALSRAVRDRGGLRRMGEDNRAQAPAYFIERCAEAYERLFQRVLGDAPTADAKTLRAEGLVSTSKSLALFTAPEWAGRAADLAAPLGL